VQWTSTGAPATRVAAGRSCRGARAPSPHGRARSVVSRDGSVLSKAQFLLLSVKIVNGRGNS